MKYCVTLIRFGCLYVEADTPGDAMDIANHQMTETVEWSDDWDASDAMEVSDDESDSFVTERAF